MQHWVHDKKKCVKEKNLEVFFCCTMSALPLKNIIVKEVVRVINTWIRLRFFWRKSFKENPGKDFSLPLSPLSSFEFWCKTNFYLFIAVALITITCAANFLQLSKKQTCRYLLFWIRGPIHRPTWTLSLLPPMPDIIIWNSFERRKAEEAGFGTHV